LLRINNAIAILAIKTNINEVSKKKANYTNFERFIRLITNLSLTIDQVALYFKNYKSTKKFFDLYNNEEIIKIIKKHNVDLKIIVD